MKKVSKSSVNYSEGMKASHCGNCSYFNGLFSCQRVQGFIESNMWCELWKGKNAERD